MPNRLRSECVNRCYTNRRRRRIRSGWMYKNDTSSRYYDLGTRMRPNKRCIFPNYNTTTFHLHPTPHNPTHIYEILTGVCKLFVNKAIQASLIIIGNHVIIRYAHAIGRAFFLLVVNYLHEIFYGLYINMKLSCTLSCRFMPFFYKTINNCQLLTKF